MPAVQEEGGPEAALAQCRASLALSMLLVLKDFLKKCYSINAERIAVFGPSGVLAGRLQALRACPCCLCGKLASTAVQIKQTQVPVHSPSHAIHLFGLYSLPGQNRSWWLPGCRRAAQAGGAHACEPAGGRALPP